MPLTNDQLRSIPMFRGMTDEQLDQLRDLFEKVDMQPGERLCTAGEPAKALYLLASGEVTLSEGDDVKMKIHAPAPIGELGALTGIERNTTATVTQPSEVWRVPRHALFQFLESHIQLALVFYQNLTEVVTDKIRRDQVRLEDMRRNLIRTQKAMKALRDFVLESEETPLSERIHDELDALITHNRRVNYRVAPPAPLPASVRFRDDDVPIAELSRTHFSYVHEDGDPPAVDDRLTAVMTLAGPEIPISGKVIRVADRRVTLELDPLIDDFAAALEGYLSRVQMVDFIV